MFHVLGAPVKPSYLILLLVPFLGGRRAGRSGRAATDRLWWYLAAPILGLALAGVAGQLYFATRFPVPSVYPAVKQTVVYLLMALAMGLGLRVRELPGWAVVVAFYGSVLTLIALSLFPERIPWLADLWWKSAEVEQEMLQRAEGRPNPFGDGSAVMSVLLFLLVAALQRRERLRLSLAHQGLIAFLALWGTIVVASRNQMIAAAIIALALALYAARRVSRGRLAVSGALAGLVVVAGAATLGPRDGAPVIERAIARFDPDALVSASDEDRASSLLRPLYTLERFRDRFIVAPILGTGYEVIPRPPFERMNFHNDLFHVLVTSGLLGGACYLLWMLRIRRTAGLLVLLPFLLPGLTNSFLLHVSGVLVYCFMIGALAGRQNRTACPSKQNRVWLSQWRTRDADAVPASGGRLSDSTSAAGFRRR